MPLLRLDHVNVRTANLAAMVDWYDRVLGLKTGPRPDFDFDGAWIYVGDQAVIHLIARETECAAIDPKIEHYAFQATGMAQMLAHLKALGIGHTVDEVPGMPIVQINLADHDGNHIHIDYTAAEYAALKDA
jgi:catechol 2,3-dioxygenase-like lactoylglutathione lyase family enzyme